jgi:hypothetical protein
VREASVKNYAKYTPGQGFLEDRGCLWGMVREKGVWKMVREPWVLDRGNLRENWGKSEPWEDGPIYGPPGTRALRYAGTGTGCGVHATVACAQQCHLRDCGARATNRCIYATVTCATVARAPQIAVFVQLSHA